MKQTIILILAALAMIAIPSCSKSDSGKPDLEYSVWITPKDDIGHYETLHFKEGNCIWTLYYKSGDIPQTYRYRTKGNKIELYLDKQIYYTLTYNQSSNTISVVAEGKSLTFTRQ